MLSVADAAFFHQGRKKSMPGYSAPLCAVLIRQGYKTNWRYWSYSKEVRHGIGCLWTIEK